MNDDKNRQLFMSLVYSFQMQTMMQMGKLANPMTQKVEKELEAAEVTIAMLDMLKEKSKGNLADDESKFLDQVIADLKLNFVEEKSKGNAPEVEEPKQEITEEKKDLAEDKSDVKSEAGKETKSEAPAEDKEASKTEAAPASKDESK